MGFTVVQSIDLEMYQLKGVAHTWCQKWKEVRGTNVDLVEQDEVVIAFLDRLFSINLRESMVQEFININQST